MSILSVQGLVVKYFRLFDTFVFSICKPLDPSFTCIHTTPFGLCLRHPGTTRQVDVPPGPTVRVQLSTVSRLPPTRGHSVTERLFERAYHLFRPRNSYTRVLIRIVRPVGHVHLHNQCTLLHSVVNCKSLSCPLDSL